MGKINGCLKCVFIFFNVLFAILGGSLIYGLRSISGSQQIQLSADFPGLALVWLFAFGIFGISLLGIVAACCEKPVVLKLFASFMGVGMIIMIYVGINVATARTQIMSALQGTSSKLVDMVMDQSDMTLEKLQQFLKCCGKLSADEWVNQIPDSCECSSSSPGYGGFYNAGCKSRPQGTRGPALIYAESCTNAVLWVIDLCFSVTLGVLFGFAVIALLGLIITAFMIHQVKRNDADEFICMKGY